MEMILSKISSPEKLAYIILAIRELFDGKYNKFTDLGVSVPDGLELIPDMAALEYLIADKKYFGSTTQELSRFLDVPIVMQGAVSCLCNICFDNSPWREELYKMVKELCEKILPLDSSLFSLSLLSVGLEMVRAKVERELQ